MAGLVAMVTGTLMAGALFVFAPWLATRTLAAPELAPLLRVGALILIFEAMNGAQTGALAGFEAFKTTAKINMWAGLANFPMMALGVYWGGLPGCVWALAANRTLNWLLNHLALRREARRAGIPFVLRGSRAELAVLWHYSLPCMLCGVMVSPTIWVCSAMLVNQPGGYDQMGIFLATSAFQQILFFLGNTLSAPLLPLLANRIGRENARLDRVNMLSTWALGALPAVILFGFPEIASVLFGKEYAGSQFRYTFLMMVFCSSIIIYKQGLGRVILAHGLMWWAMLSNLVWAGILIGCTWLLVSRGAFGYSIAWAVAYGLNTALFFPLYIRKHLVPRETIVSLEAGLIWLMLIVGMTLNFLGISFAWRLVTTPIIMLVVCWLFWRLLMHNSRTL
ncbi:MAG: oligosaccharide flippase family protein [Candidatus Sumerlaeota bacterium]|nr:oligosaccharide flippase family protein [Candidatus Sumerlaeota bacterium]